MDVKQAAQKCYPPARAHQPDRTSKRGPATGSQSGSQAGRRRPPPADVRRTKAQVSGLPSTPIDTQNRPTDQKVGGSNPSERTRKVQVRALFAWFADRRDTPVRTC